MIESTQMTEALRNLGGAGKPVCVHASMRAFGDRVEGGAEGVLRALLHHFGTVMTPAFSYGFLASPKERYLPPQNGTDYRWYREHPLHPEGVFTPDCKVLSVEDMGELARTVLHHPDALRGDHPLNSFAAAGIEKQTLISGQNGQKLYAPFEALCRLGGFVLMMGTDLGSTTLLHYAEQLAGRTPFVRWAQGRDGTVRPVHVGSCSKGFEQLAPCLKHLEKRCKVGESVFRLYPARDMAEAAARAIRQNPMITHCGSPDCTRCRDAVKGGPVLTDDFFA